ncbi:uncharacterized protein EAE97_007756 [Botrytis byssoidea]|uniref:Uncharacterized protein n=1 Tax=Botrytis byssoidea TaxID=139641 RepID=A0A9P5IJM5_9HELO|nr:uncharacterized protein EAE97_007756 [Botrytis byssoidea]KAF7937960.1 hypothetical protein EAE97_007756 [Botrytis byssoidea]
MVELKQIQLTPLYHPRQKPSSASEIGATQAASNDGTHGHERIWFYYAYNLAWKLYGAEQTKILPILKARNQINNIKVANKGSLADGQLNFQEFMDRIAYKPPGTCQVQLNTEDLDGTAVALSKAGFGGTVKVGIATNTATSKIKTSYNQMLENLMGVVTDAREKFPGDSVVSDTMSQMEKLADKIAHERSLDFSQAKWLGMDIAAGFKLPADQSNKPTTITYKDVPNLSEDSDADKTITVVDVMATFNDPRNKSLIKKGLEANGVKKGTLSRFKDWVDNYGAKPIDGSKGPDYQPSSVSHRTTLTLWTSAKGQINRPVC